jgi:hypothetical protein
MNNNEKNAVKNICKFCLTNYQIQGSSRLISSLIYQLCREMGIDAPAVEGILYVDIKGHRRPFSHCFNVINCDIIDCTIYSYALANKSISELFPAYIIGTPPDHLDYVIDKEIKPDSQFKFQKHYLQDIISQLDNYSDVKIERFTEYEDAKKQNLFYAGTRYQL